MANNENLIPIPGRLHSVATEGHVAGADEIYDDTQSKLQSAINADVAEDISDLQEIVGEGSVDTRIENAVKALDAEKSQTAGADGLALSVTEVDGKITSISGSIATDTYDSYGSASAAQEAAATDATTKVNAAKAELLGDAATDYNTLGKLEDAIQSEASTRETEIGTDSTAGSVKGRIKSLETLVGTTDVDSQIDAKINALDSTKSQTAGTDGLALSIEEEDGKIKSISGSIAANTYDAYGAASTAKSDLLGDAASDYNTLGKLEDAIQVEATTRSGETEALDGRLDDIEDVIPSAASSSNQLADKSFVNSSISTATAEFQGSYNSVSDLELTTSATHAQIATALGTEISGADNNDYCFVQIPTADATPTDIAKVERYKYNGTAWSFEYELNNSGYTDAQWAAINSGITTNLVTAFGNKYDKPSTGIPSTDMTSDVQTSLGKADSAYQKPSGGIPDSDLTSAVQTSLGKADTAYQKPSGGIPLTDLADGVIPDISGKQDVIDSTHKLDADLVDDTSSTNKFTNATEKQTWNAKQDALTFNTTPSSSNKVATMADLADCAYLGDDDGSAIVPSFDPETDTLHKAAQVLTTAQKDQVAQNLNNRGTTNGMGRIELKATDNFKTVVEAQTGGNTIFVIKYDFTLTGDVTVPANCVLEFDGGSLSNGTLTGNNTVIEAGLIKIFNTDITLAGSWNIAEAYPEWFGAVGDRVTDDSPYFQATLNLASTSNIRNIAVSEKSYNFDSPLYVYNYTCLHGKGDGYYGEKLPFFKFNNCDGLVFMETNENPNTILNISVYNISMYGAYNEPNENHDGIVINGQGTKDISSCTIKNVSVLFFRYGLRIENRERKNLLSEGFIENCRFNNNKVGIYINGKQDGSNNTGGWMNDTTIKGCTISSNTSGGIFINYLWSCIQVRILNCCIENNGRKYNINDYNSIGNFGIKLHYLPTSEVIISKCYFEKNIPSRTGTPTDDEYLYDGAVHPKEFYNSANNGTICAYDANVSIENCSFFSYDRIATIDNASTVSIKDCDVTVSKLYETQSDSPTIRFNKQKINRCNLLVENMTYVELNDLSFTLLDIPVTSESTLQLFESTIVSKNVHPRGYYREYKDDFVYKGGVLKGGHFFVNGTSQNTVNDLGLTPARPFPNIYKAFLYPVLRELYNVSDKIYIEVTGESNIQYTGLVNNKIWPKLHIYSKNKQVLNTDRTTGNLGVFFHNDVTFENITLNIDGQGDNWIFDIKTEGNTIIFKNCVINFLSNDDMIHRTSFKTKFIFDNCIFTAVSGISCLPFSIGVDTPYEFEFINCTLPVWTNVKSSDSVTTLTRPTVCLIPGMSVFDIDLNKTIWWNGSAWVDATGATV